MKPINQPKFTDNEISDACLNCANSMDLDMLISFVAEELYDYYTTKADPDTLEFFMKENADG